MTKQTTSCPSCGRAGLVEVSMKVKTGEELTMLSCSRCEERRWLADGTAVSREEVLRLTSGNPDFVTAAVQRTRKSSRTT